jgi:RNA polymerase sigma-70 factor (ECF subfamily)
MKTGDTTLGGGGSAFPETTLGFAGKADPETLCRRYWKPVYSWLRIARARSNDDAKDLTQEFFLWMVEGGVLARYRRERGGFRSWLKTVLGHFVSHQDRDGRRQKRGGGAPIFRLEGELPPVDPQSDPEKAFERAWFEDLVGQAVARVRGREGSRFRVYEAYALAAEPPTYAELAASLGLTLGEVEKALYLVREEIRREIREALAGADGELEDEWKRLLGK